MYVNELELNASIKCVYVFYFIVIDKSVTETVFKRKDCAYIGLDFVYGECLKMLFLGCTKLFTIQFQIDSVAYARESAQMTEHKYNLTIPNHMTETNV